MKRADCHICGLNTGIKKSGTFVRHGRPKDSDGKLKGECCPGSDCQPGVAPEPDKPKHGRKTIVHVNQHIIRANHKTGARDPVLTVKQGRTNRYAHEVRIDGPSKVVYSPDKPLSCGARVWIESYYPVELDPN